MYWESNNNFIICLAWCVCAYVHIFVISDIFWEYMHLILFDIFYTKYLKSCTEMIVVDTLDMSDTTDLTKIQTESYDGTN